MTTILVADDHPIILKGLRTVLEVEHELHIVGSAMNGREAIQKVEHYKPDLLILDLALPDINGLEVLRQIRKISPDTRVLILSMHDDKPFIVAAFKNGALGYMVKDSANTELVAAVRKVASGRPYLNSHISQPELDAYLEKGKDAHLNSQGG